MRMNDIHALFMKKWSNKKYVIQQLQVIFALSRTILVWDQLKSKQFDHVIVQKGKAFEFGCAFNFLLYSLQLAAFQNDLGQYKTFFHLLEIIAWKLEIWHKGHIFFLKYFSGDGRYAKFIIFPEHARYEQI